MCIRDRVEMELDNHLWHVLKDTPKVTGFLGTGDKPVAPVSYTHLDVYKRQGF